MTASPPRCTRSLRVVVANGPTPPAFGSLIPHLKKTSHFQEFPDMEQSPSRSKFHLSLDSWAVIIALLAALLVRSGVFKNVPW